MKRLRMVWAIVAVVGAVTVVVPGLRDEARLEWATLPPLRQALHAQPPRHADPLLSWFFVFRTGPMQAALRRHAGDPELTSAAGTLLLPPEAGLSALQQAAQTAHSPLLWSAYVDARLAATPRYERVGTSGVDPAQRLKVAAVERVIAQRHLPTSLSPKEAQPLLEAVQDWRQADPNNGLPLAVEAWCLYGLHRDAEALARWEEAAGRKRMDSYDGPRVTALRRVLVEAGYPEPEAILVAQMLHSSALDRMQTMAWVALHEGRRAQLAGRAREAVREWQATQVAGRRLEDSAETFLAFTTGAAIESTGGAPAWYWQSGGEETPGRGELLEGGEHAFYAAQVGAAADAQLRTGLLQTRQRLNLLQKLLTLRDEPQWYPRAGDVLAFAQILLVFVLAATLLALLIRLPGTGEPALRSPWHLVISLPALVALALLAGLTTALALPASATPWRVPAGAHFWGSVAAALVVAVLCPLLAALFLRPAGVSRLRAWRLNLLTGLAPVVAIAAVVYLGSGLAAMKLRTNWVRQSLHSGVTEMQMLGRFGGAATAPPGKVRGEKRRPR